MPDVTPWAERPKLTVNKLPPVLEERMANLRAELREPEIAIAEKPQKLTLREITESLLAWRETLSASEDESDIPVIQAKLEQVERMHSDKVDGFCWFLRWLASEQASLAKEAMQFTSRKKAWERLEGKLRRLSADLMQSNALDSMQGRVSKLLLMAGRKKLVIEESQLPAHYLRHVEQVIIPAHDVPDTEAIEAALKRGVDVPGARLAEGEPFVQVR